MNAAMWDLLAMALIIIAVALTIRANVLIRRAAEELERAALAMLSDSSSRNSLRDDASSSFALSQDSTSNLKSDPGTPNSCCASNLATAAGLSSSRCASVDGDIVKPNVTTDAPPLGGRGQVSS